jgi:hypothetical protein
MTVLPDQIGFVLEFAVGMRFSDADTWPNSFSGAAFVAAPGATAVLVDELDASAFKGCANREIVRKG